ncbi:MAG: DUF2147 domain-containing protein [Melioribacteraceae bacterium]|nr:DUF2147 domain-containing protein [Melioribacteraceae bacterium]
MTSIKKRLLLIIFSFSINYFAIAQNEADAIVGTWLMPDDEGIIEICKDDELYKGKILWIQEKEDNGSPLKDKENPIESLRNRNVQGLQVMQGFNYEEDNTWSGGTFYAAKKGKEVEPEFVLVDKDHLNIEISIFVFSMTVELTRVDTAQYFQNRKVMEK